MSDAGSINNALTQRIASNASADAAPRAKIVDIPESLERTERPEKLRGTVTARERDGTLRVQTERGEVRVKPDKPVKIDKGDTVEVKIEKGNPPQSATVRPAPKASAKTPPQERAQAVQAPPKTATLPPKVTLEKLANAATPVPVETLTPKALQHITRPFIHTLQNALSQVTNSGYAAETTAALPGLTDLSLISTLTPTSAPTRQSEALPQLSTLWISSDLGHTNQINLNNFAPSSALFQPSVNDTPITESFTQLQPPRTDVPLRTLMAQIISNPLEAPLQIPQNTLETPAPFGLRNIQIEDISPPKILISAPEVQGLPWPPQPPEQSVEGRDRAHMHHAEIIGYTKERHFPVLQIISPDSTHPPQHYALHARLDDIPLGTRLSLHVTETTGHPAPIGMTTGESGASSTTAPLPALTAPFPPITSAYFLTPERWPVLQDIQNTLAQAAPQVAQAFTNMVPSAANPTQFGGSALFFLAALRSGDIQSWLGEKAVETLKRAGKGDLITRLGREITALSRLNSEPVSQDWRAMALPFAWQNEIDKIPVYYRQEDTAHDDENKKSGGKTRFVMDLNLSNIGKVQLDNLYHAYRDGGGRLDAVLRTEDNFSSAMKAQMRQSFKAALDETSISGELSFQGSLDDWVHITPDKHRDYEQDV